MKSTVETLSPTRVRLEIEVPFAELEPNLKKAYQTIGAQVNVPGFRKGKVPPAVIDRRIGRGAVLNEAVQSVIPEQLVAAFREHEVKTIGRPEVEVSEFADGQPLKFTAQIDVRPELELPELDTIEVTVDLAEVSDSDLDEQVATLRERFATLKTVERAALNGDYVQLDLAASVDGQDVPGGSATNVSHEVGSGQLVPGLDEVLVGMTAGQAANFNTQLVGGEYAGKDAQVSVSVRTVKEKQLPELDDSFASLASEFDTLEELRGDLRTRLERIKRMEQLYHARDKALNLLIEKAEVPAPEGVVREEIEHRKQTMTEQLERMGASLEDYLASEGKTVEEMDTEVEDAATEAVKVQLVLDALAEAQNVEVSDDEFGYEVVNRAKRAGVAPQEYYEHLMRTGNAAGVFGDVRRGKALTMLLEKIRIADSDGNQLSLDDLRGPTEVVAQAEDAHDHDHDHEGDHDHEH